MSRKAKRQRGRRQQKPPAKRKRVHLDRWLAVLNTVAAVLQLIIAIADYYRRR